MKTAIFYKDDMVLQDNIDLSYSKSPLKPKIYTEQLGKVVDLSFIDFDALEYNDFLLAHENSYVDNVFNFNKPGVKLSSNIPWSKELVKTLGYTSGSLYSAISYAMSNSAKGMRELVIAPVSGFHHARPSRGSGFCTFSGQVVASVKLYQQFGYKGCYLDLDGHYGNSIKDTRSFQPDLEFAIPEGFNFNPAGYSAEYLIDLYSFLNNKLFNALKNNEIDYLV
jgi:acetoin utilization deacetylase AcuC-like enzyme